MKTLSTKVLKTLGKKQMLLATLIGKVEVRMKDRNPLEFPDEPQLKMPFYRRKDRWLRAGELVLDAIVSGDVLEHKETTTDAEGDTRTLTYVKIVGATDKPKELTKGFSSVAGDVYQKDVGGRRLRVADKAPLVQAASTKFYKSATFTEEYYEKLVSFIPLDASSRELPFKRAIRFDSYKEAMSKLKSFYLPMKYDTRDRMYYEAARIEGFRPHGKSCETFAFEVKRRPLTLTGFRHLSALHYPNSMKLGDTESMEDLRDYLRSEQRGKSMLSGQTGMLLEVDITNSGLLILGLASKSPEMLMATNGYASDVRADSHTVFGNAYGITDRDVAKGVHTPLLHGASTASVVKVLQELTGVSYSVEEVDAKNEEVYGKAVHNIHALAEYGRNIMSNFRSTVSWTMPDGMRASHKASTLHVPMELKLSIRNVRVMAEMPLLLDSNNRPVYDKDAHGAHPGTASKVMGLLANIVHSIDAYVMRRVVESGIEILCKHDAFLVHPNDVDELVLMLKQIYSDIYDLDIIRHILGQIEQTTGVKAPELFIGEAENKMKESNLFFSVE